MIILVKKDKKTDGMTVYSPFKRVSKIETSKEFDELYDGEEIVRYSNPDRTCFFKTDYFTYADVEQYLKDCSDKYIPSDAVMRRVKRLFDPDVIPEDGILWLHEFIYMVDSTYSEKEILLSRHTDMYSAIKSHFHVIEREVRDFEKQEKKRKAREAKKKGN